jgi:UDP-glucose 4-epimerase
MSGTWLAPTCSPCRARRQGIGTSIKELTEILLDLTGSDLPIQYEPAGLTFVTNRIGSIDAAKRDFGFTWSVDLEEGLRSLIEWRNADRESLRAKQLAVGGVSNA